MSTQNGAMVDSRMYHAYGSKRGGDDYPFEPNYTGQRKEDIGLLYYNARYYDPELGMFIFAITHRLLMDRDLLRSIDTSTE